MAIDVAFSVMGPFVEHGDGDVLLLGVLVASYVVDDGVECVIGSGDGKCEGSWAGVA